MVNTSPTEKHIIYVCKHLFSFFLFIYLFIYFFIFFFFFSFCFSSYIYRYTLCSDPRAQPDPIGESEPKPQGRPFNYFYLHFISFSFSKNVTTQILGPTRMADSNRSPVYSDIFIYLIKKFYYVISLRKRFQFWASP